jgi:hypothetical protein
VTAFALTSEQQDLAERVRDLASGQLRTLADAGTPGQVNRELIKAMGDLGLLARLFPGIGAGGLSREAALALQGLSVGRDWTAAGGSDETGDQRRRRARIAGGRWATVVGGNRYGTARHRVRR